MEIKLVNFDSLTDEEKEGASNNGRGKDDANYIRISHNGETIFLESDAIEPEDCTFRRDLKWIITALRRCYEIGKSE